jgi:UDP-N-acetylglucosamine:LPS N-acetylglucosamine transferase
MSKNKILALSSPGGHWVQLCRILPALADCEVIYACTYNKPAELSPEDSYHIIEDISRDTIIRVPGVVAGILKIIKQERPDYVVTTGALPGLITIFLARLLGIKSIWLDSIANSEKISFSGRVAAFLANDCFTQWEGLATNRVKYIGRVI